MIIDSQENIRLRKEKSQCKKRTFWSIVAWSSCCIQNFKTPISVAWQVHSPDFCTEMGDRVMKQLHWACTARGHTYVRKGVFLFFGKDVLFLFLGVQVDAKFHKVWKILLLLLHHMVHIMTQNMKGRKNMVQVLPVACCWVGPWPQLALLVRNKNKALIPLEPFRNLDWWLSWITLRASKIPYFLNSTVLIPLRWLEIGFELHGITKISELYSLHKALFLMLNNIFF